MAFIGDEFLLVFSSKPLTFYRADKQKFLNFSTSFEVDLFKEPNDEVYPLPSENRLF
jgi:hypothetical protein